MKNWFYQLSRAKQIVLGVLIAHISFVLFLLGQNLIYTWPTKKNKVTVNMVHISPPKMKAPPSPVATLPKSAPVTKKPAPAKKAAPKVMKAIKESPANKPEPIAKPEPPANGQPEFSASLLKEIEACIETISAQAPKPSNKTTILIPTLHQPTTTTTEAETSEEIMAAFLAQSLTLPEFGEVRAYLVVDRWGHLETLDILHAKSEKNGSFLKNRLPELQFPCLNEGVSLTVIFSNAQ